MTTARPRASPAGHDHRAGAATRASTGSCCGGRPASTRGGPTGCVPWAGAARAVRGAPHRRPRPGRPARRRRRPGPGVAGGLADRRRRLAGDDDRRRRQLLRASGSRSAFVPLAAAHRGCCRPPARCSAAQSASLALGVVPIWHLARKVVNLRVGAAARARRRLRLPPGGRRPRTSADFHPATLALTPLLVAAYAAERRQWARFGVASLLTVVAWSSELGLVIATMGVILVARGRAADRHRHRASPGWPGPASPCSSSRRRSAPASWPPAPSTPTATPASRC